MLLAAPWPLAGRASHLILVALLLLVPAGAQAWTRTRVTGASAHLDVLHSGQLRVVLKSRLKVTGGWISRFEIEGLESDLELDPHKPVWLSALDGTKYPARVKHEGNGRVVVSFENRKVAPWRGEYELGIVYTTASPMGQAVRMDGGMVKLDWTMPAWSLALEDVTVQIAGPARLSAEPTDDYAVEFASTQQEGYSALEWRRVQLPQMTPWTLSFQVPTSALAAAALPSMGPRVHKTLSGSGPAASSLWLSALLCLLALAKRRLTRGAAALAGAQPQALIASRPMLRVAGMLSLALGGALLLDQQPAAALVLLGLVVALGLHRQFNTAAATELRAREATKVDLQRARTRTLLGWVSGPAWLDATTPTGVAVLLSSLALAGLVHHHNPGADDHLSACLLALPLFFTSTRLHLPSSGDQRLLRMQGLLTGLQQTSPELEGRLVLQVLSASGSPASDVRVQLRPSCGWQDGAELSLVVGESEWLGARRELLCVLASARAGSPTQERLARALPHGSSTTTHDRAARLAPTSDPAADLALLEQWLAVPEQAQQISEPERSAADRAA